MTRAHRILCSIGTRPEAIKMAPVIEALRNKPWAGVRVLATAQHRGLLDDILRNFSITPDLDLDLMRPDQTLAELTGRLAPALDRALADEAPDYVLAQGDTTSVLMTALACHYRRIPFGHVEAGLRTGRRYNPFPEEMNRILTSPLADLHFAPTEAARQNLLREGIDPDSIHVTGNTVIDALLATAARNPSPPPEAETPHRIILMTAHRRENFGEPFQEVLLGARDAIDAVKDALLVYPLHPNPNVRGVARAVLGSHDRVRLIDPLDYPSFVGLMARSAIIITDSGGVQEEAPALGRPVLVFREETERPEAVDAGVVKLVGPCRSRIAKETIRLMTDPAAHADMARGVSPYGDGMASARIVDALAARLGVAFGH